MSILGSNGLLLLKKRTYISNELDKEVEVLHVLLNLVYAQVDKHILDFVNVFIRN